MYLKFKLYNFPFWIVGKANDMTWTLPKALRVFLKNDKSLFAEISKMIFKLINKFYNLAACKSITTGCALCYQSYGDLLRFNSHFHGVFLEGGFDKDGNFIFIPIHDTTKLTQSFRKMIVRYFYGKGLITKSFAQTLLSWKNSGFSINNSFRIYGSEQKKIESIGQYLTRAPISLQKIEYIKTKGKVLLHTKYNEYFKENLKLLKAEDFIALLVQHSVGLAHNPKVYVLNYRHYRKILSYLGKATL
jgi:hypothetical protein